MYCLPSQSVVLDLTRPPPQLAWTGLLQGTHLGHVSLDVTDPSQDEAHRHRHRCKNLWKIFWTLLAVWDITWMSSNLVAIMPS